MPADAAVLTIEYKINLLAPAQGPALPHGRRWCSSRAAPSPWPKAAPIAIDDGREKLIATMSATLMAVTGRDGIQH